MTLVRRVLTEDGRERSLLWEAWKRRKDATESGFCLTLWGD